MILDARIPDGPIDEKWRIWKDNHSWSARGGARTM